MKIKLEQLALLEKKIELREGLPHLHGLKLYPWQQDYKDAKTIKKRLLCAANQIGKSSIQIMDRIDIATNKDLWPILWPDTFKINPNTNPYSWYLYPNQDTVLTEFYEKWVPYYMPAGKYKDSKKYGWKEVVVNKVLKRIEFNSGYTIYFKTYNQNVQDLQSGTVFAIDCDEELPEHLLSELQARLFASDGYFSMVFTATLGQEFWRKVIECSGTDEKWADAWKRQISMFDCQRYVDGSASRWTDARIAQVINNCKNRAEALRRVHGRFVRSDGLKYTGFDRERNLRHFPKSNHGRYYKGPPNNWDIYSAVDIGSGGEFNHPAGMVFLAVSPKMDRIRVFRCRRMDDIETTAGDIYNEYDKLRGTMTPCVQSYDYASKDYGTIVSRVGESWVKAKKDHAIGEMALNAALKSGILQIYYDPTDTEDEAMKLVAELEGMPEGKDKRRQKDDLIDALRYAIVEVPIDWEKVLDSGVVEIKGAKPDEERIRGWTKSEEEEYRHSFGQDEIDQEFEEYNELLGFSD